MKIKCFYMFFKMKIKCAHFQKENKMSNFGIFPKLLHFGNFGKIPKKFGQI